MSEKCFCHLSDGQGNTYLVKDKEARERIEALEQKTPDPCQDTEARAWCETLDGKVESVEESIEELDQTTVKRSPVEGTWAYCENDSGPTMKKIATGSSPNCIPLRSSTGNLVGTASAGDNEYMIGSEVKRLVRGGVAPLYEHRISIISPDPASGPQFRVNLIIYNRDNTSITSIAPLKPYLLTAHVEYLQLSPEGTDSVVPFACGYGINTELYLSYLKAITQNANNSANITRAMVTISESGYTINDAIKEVI